MRKTVIAANWKMHKNLSETEEYGQKLMTLLASPLDAEVVICPAFTSLQVLSKTLEKSPVKIGAQNLFWENSGAYTGEISAPLLLDCGCRYVIVGHSERRHLMNESDASINRKLKAALNNSLIPIFCVGETLPERQNNMARQVVKEQLSRGLDEVSLTEGKIVIAYEPVWAIGTGINANPDDAQEMIAFIRETLAGLYNMELAQSISILYGGSVKTDNIADFMDKKDIDGALVGGASLNVHDFARIVRLGKDV